MKKLLIVLTIVLSPLLSKADEFATFLALNSNKKSQPLQGENQMPQNQLVKTDIILGTGTEVKQGSTVTVQYTGWLNSKKGTEFDSSIGRGPFSFKVGEGQVIQGWDDGLLGMRVGGVRELTIPPKMGYGKRGAGGVIPPDATLFFEIELLEVK
jgi:FKBP-type peptidyl-prolyl cis-trans isomerase FkpA